MKNWSRIKSRVNLIIDFIMLLNMMTLAGIGFLIKYVLLPGYKASEVYGNDSDLFFWGLDRHQWGAIHLYVALFLVFLLLLHIILHWDMVVCILKKMIHGRTARTVVLLAIGLISLFIALGPLFLKPEVRQMERVHQHRRHMEITVQDQDQSLLQVDADSEERSEKSSADTARKHFDDLDINGTMSLNEISKRFGISAGELASVIGVPADKADERIGRLKRIYEFDVNDLRGYVKSKTGK
ncbi:MAG: DUF4405 domain-containing protein [Bacteroidales bacterium]|nr:DUF4405 domain-containing protein [Bacteroidales bacterium]